MHEETLLDLISQASYMLLDRPRPEADLIYHVARLDPDERAAIVLAYQNAFKEKDGQSP